MRITLPECSPGAPDHRVPNEAACSRGTDGSLIELPDFLSPAVFQTLCSEVDGLVGIERSYVPTHKQGGTVAYSTLRRQAPGISEFYGSESLHGLISQRLGCKVKPTPMNDENSLSLLIYDRPGDRIGWHHDHDFYRGRHFTLLVPLVNRGSTASGLSHAQLSVRLPGQGERVVDTGPNQAVLFEGARVLHKVSPILAGERRIVLSMTFCSDSHASRAQGIARRVKDMAFFGVRALWT